MGLFLSPFFVVINTTPLLALDPYIAALPASFSTDTLSMSEGLRELMSPPMIPSITIRGLLFPRVLTPLILRLRGAPGSELGCCMVRLGDFPCKAWVVFTDARP